MAQAHHDYSPGQLEECVSLEGHGAAHRQLAGLYSDLVLERA